MSGWGILFALLACGGCSVHKPAFRTYRLVGQGGSQILIPPGVATPELAQRTFTVDRPAGRPSCSSGGEAISIEARKKRLRVTVRRDALSRQPPGWLGIWAAEIEGQECLPPGDGQKLAERIAESLPLAANAAFQLMHASESRTGRVDIGSQTRLQVISPLLREGAENLIGYETAWYAVRPKTSGVGFTITPLFADRNIQGATERRPQPVTNYFSFPTEAAFCRLFYKAGQTEFTALVIAARTEAELEQRTKLLETGIASCGKLDGNLCVAIPKQCAVNPLVAVSVNGSEVLVSWGARVADAIRKAGERQPSLVLPQLAIYKLHGGGPVALEFDRHSPAILDVVLTGGESLTWK